MKYPEDVIALEETRAKIINPGNWCQRYLWTNDKGDEWIQPADATAYCMMGALFVVTGRDNDDTQFNRLTTWLGGQRAVAMLNDNHSHDEVIAFLDRRIADLKKQQMAETT